jgi:hypothetical protein
MRAEMRELEGKQVRLGNAKVLLGLRMGCQRIVCSLLPRCPTIRRADGDPAFAKVPGGLPIPHPLSSQNTYNH